MLKTLNCRQVLSVIALSMLLIPLANAQDSTAMNLIDGFQGLGDINDAEIFGDYLLVAGGSTGIWVVEDHLTDNPNIVLQIEELGVGVESIIVDENTVYAVGNYLDRYDFTDPLNPILLDRNEWSWAADYNVGFTPYLNKLLFSQFHCISTISWDHNGDIEIEILLDLDDYNLNLMSFEVYNNHIFIFNHNYMTQERGFMIWNIFDMENPLQVDVNQEILDFSPHYIALDGDDAVLTNETEVAYVNIQDYENMEILDTWEYNLSGYPNLYWPRLIDNSIIISSYNSDVNTGAMIILEVDNQNQIQFIEEIIQHGIVTYNNTLSGDYLIFMSMFYGLTICDLTAPSTPLLIPSWNPTSAFYATCRVQNSIYTYTNSTMRPLQIFDYSDNNQVVLSGEFLPEEYWGLRATSNSENYLVLSLYEQAEEGQIHSNTRTQIAQPAPDNPSELVLCGVVEDTIDLFETAISGNTLYGISTVDSTFRIYNIADIDNPHLENSIQLSTRNSNYRILIDENILYMGSLVFESENSGLIQVYDISDPFLPIHLSDFSMMQSNDFFIGDGYLVVGSFFDLILISTEDPENLTVMSTIELNSPMNGISGGYVADFHNDVVILKSNRGIYNPIGYLQIVDISDHDNPEYIGAYTLPGTLNAMFADDKIFATWGSGYGLFTWDANSIGKNTSNALPELSSLSVYPNPANPSTTISLNLATSGEVTLKMFDLLGRELRTISSGYFSAGRHQIYMSDFENVASGTYFIQAQSGSWVQTQKILILK